MKLNNVEDLREEHELLCRELGLLGKVIIAQEGINGCLSGDDDSINKYSDYIQSTFDINDSDIKITDAEQHTFRKLWVKIKSQIINTKNWDANIEHKAEYIEPEELKSKFDAGEDMIILDARNNYEYDSGHFKNALYPNIRWFSHFHEMMKDIEGFKDKQVITYCTGGIRCEKASAFLRENGFRNVKQLHGGVINYAKKFGSEHWEGKCLVFDKRNELDMDSLNHSSN
jgi:UPF0176 protein